MAEYDLGEGLDSFWGGGRFPACGVFKRFDLRGEDEGNVGLESEEDSRDATQHDHHDDKESPALLFVLRARKEEHRFE